MTGDEVGHKDHEKGASCRSSDKGRLMLRTRGRNPAVRDGRPFIINLNVTGNVDRLAAVAAQALQLPSTLVRTIVPNAPVGR